MFAAAFVTLALSASALANVYITNPVASTIWTAGQTVNVTWQDDGQSPSLESFGPATISVYVGNAQQQTSIYTIATNTDVSKTNAVSFVPEANMGPISNDYFIRIESVSLKSGQYNAMAFSAKFGMTGMTGTFNSAELAQIAGQSTAPLASQSTTVSLPTSSATGAATTGASKSAASLAASATSTSTSGARGTAAVSGLAAIAGVAVAMVGSALF